jgi:hypothetical protein
LLFICSRIKKGEDQNRQGGFQREEKTTLGDFFFWKFSFFSEVVRKWGLKNKISRRGGAVSCLWMVLREVLKGKRKTLGAK